MKRRTHVKPHEIDGGQYGDLRRRQTHMETNLINRLFFVYHIDAVPNVTINTDKCIVESMQHPKNIQGLATWKDTLLLFCVGAPTAYAAFDQEEIPWITFTRSSLATVVASYFRAELL